MITLFSGTPGSGKSLHLARQILVHLRLKHYVIANFDLNRDMIKKWEDHFFFIPNDKLNPDDLKRFAISVFQGKRIKEDSIYLVIDESQMLFNSREWGKSDRKPWLDFFTVHRHFGFHIVLVAQFDQMLDKQIRGLIEYEIIHRKVSNFGLKGWILSAVFLAPSLFVAVKVWYPMSEKVDSEFFRYSKKFGQLYDSYALFSADGAPVGAVSALISE